MAKKQLTGLSSVACDAAEADRTITLTRDDLNDLVTSIGFGFSFVPGAAGDTVITVVLYKSCDNGSTWHRVPAWNDQGSGLFVGSDFSQRVTLTETDGFWVDVDMKNANAVKMIFSTDTADALDAMTVSACAEYGRW